MEYIKLKKKLRYRVIALIIEIIIIIFLSILIIVFNSNHDDNHYEFSPSMNQQAKDAYNSKFTSYIGNARNKNDVKELIDNVISMNNENVNQPGKFIQLTLKNDILKYSIGEAGCKENDDEYVENAIKELGELRKIIESNTGKFTIENTMESRNYN